MHYIYVLQNKINLKLYVGRSSNPTKRFKTHIRTANNYDGKKYASQHKYIHAAIKKYGDKNFNFIIIEEHNNANDCCEAEMFWIEFFRSYDKNYGYNLSLGGENAMEGRQHSDISKKKMSLAKLGIPISQTHKNNIGSANKGKKLSQITKNKISVSNLGSANGKSFLQEEDIKNIRNYFTGNNQTSKEKIMYLSNKYNMSFSGIKQIVTYKRWVHVK